MALRTAQANGDWHVAGTWAGGVVPSGADTFATSTFTVTVQTAGGAAGCAGGTITAGGKLSNQSTAGFTITGAVTWNGTFEMLGSGSNATPTLLTMGGDWTRGSASVANLVGTLGATTPDIKIVGAAATNFVFQSTAFLSDVITGVEFSGFGDVNNGVMQTVVDFVGSGSTYSDLLFKSGAGAAFKMFSGAGQYVLSGDIIIDSYTATVIGANALTIIEGTASIKIQNSVGAAAGIISGPKFKGTTAVWQADAAVLAGSKINTTWFLDSASLKVSEVSNGLTVAYFLDNSSCELNCTAANQIIFSSSVLDTDGLINIASASNGIIFSSQPIFMSIRNVAINVTTGTVVLIATSRESYVWQASRTRRFDIVGATTVTLEGTNANPQYEPVLYRYAVATNMFCLQYDMTNKCPNYAALFSTAGTTGWTATTKTLAAGGVLCITTVGNTSTGMDLAISSFAAAAISHTGTAAGTFTFKISFDGGVLWSAELTLAQLQTDTYVINGNTYYTDGRYDIQLQIFVTSAGGGTVTQVVMTGIEIDPNIVAAWTIRGELENIEGVGFATGTDDLNTIKDTAKAIKNLAGALQ